MYSLIDVITTYSHKKYSEAWFLNIFWRATKTIHHDCWLLVIRMLLFYSNWKTFISMHQMSFNKWPCLMFILLHVKGICSKGFFFVGRSMGIKMLFTDVTISSTWFLWWYFWGIFFPFHFLLCIQLPLLSLWFSTALGNNVIYLTPHMIAQLLELLHFIGDYK